LPSSAVTFLGLCMRTRTPAPNQTALLVSGPQRLTIAELAASRSKQSH